MGKIKISVNEKSIALKFQNDFFRSNRAIGLSKGILLNKLRAAKSDMLAVFDKHPITKEINSEKRSQIINYPKNGNATLFSLIGFNKGSDPLKDFRELIEREIEISNRPRISGPTHFFRVSNILTEEDIYDVTPFPPEVGVGNFSWVRAIEEGSIPHIENYIAIEDKGRSGGGLQNIRLSLSASIAATPYAETIVQAFRERF